MKFLIRKLDKKVGRPPGETTYYGEEQKLSTEVTLIQYDSETFQSKIISKSDELSSIDLNKSTWINVSGFANVELIKLICKIFDIHEMVVEDILNTEHLPKYEEGDDNLIFVVKSFVEKNADLIPTHATILMKKNLVLSFQENASSLIPQKIERIRNGKGRARRKKTDYLFFVLLDTFVDSYYLFFERLREKTMALEEKILTHTSDNHIQNIYDLKNELSSLRKNLFPLKTAINGILSDESELIEDDNFKYFADCKDHINELVEYYQFFQEIINNLISLNENNLNNHTNRIMKVLTIIATIFIPLTFIAGIYGMNFKFMPELELRYGYFYAIILMVLIGVFIVLFMRKKKWL